MKDNGVPQPPTKPHNTMSSPSANPIDDPDMDIYAKDPDDEFDMLDSDDELTIPEQLQGLGDWIEARPPPEYSEDIPSTISSSKKEHPSSSPLRTPVTNVLTAPQAEPHPLLLNDPQIPNVLQSNRTLPLAPQVPSPSTLCAVCQWRPRHNETAWTCGDNCQQILAATWNKSNTRLMEGQMANPRTGQTAPNNDFSQSGNSWSPHSIRMCEVCHVRPKCQRGGKTYPTCGLTCAAKLNPPGSVGMCDFCKKRPRAVVNGRIFPQCGKTCRDNAKMAIAAVANSSTCTTCVICWRAPTAGDSSDYCSTVCQVAANDRAPFLIELPRGHRAFRKVADVYVDSWKQTRNAIPRIKRIYMVQVKGSALENYEQYRKVFSSTFNLKKTDFHRRGRVNSHALFRKKGNEQRVWLGIARECGFGDPGNVEPCSSAACQLCCIVRSHPTQQMLTEGIQTTASLPRAVDVTKNTKRRSSRVVLLASVLYGKVAEWSENLPPKVPPGYDSIHLVGYTRTGNKLDFQETLVYHKDAIRPLYLITLD